VRGISAATLAGYDVLVLNYNGPRWGEATERAIEEFLRQGKGMIGFHGISYGEFFGQVLDKRWTKPAGSGDGWKAYPDMMGQTWKPENIGHSARHVFKVKWVDPAHPVAAGLEAEFLANDELYHKMDHRPNIHVLASAYSDPKVGGTGKDEPMIWTVPFGSGRVVHMTLGHDLEAMSSPGFVTAFARGAEWAATGAVTLPAKISPFAEPKPDAVRVLAVTGGHGYPVAFYSLLEGWDDVRWAHAASPAEAFKPDMAKRWDVVVLHDMGETLGDKEKAALEAFVRAGKGVVSTHHAIVDYTSWPWWWQEVIGGKYFVGAMPGHEKSAYKEGVEVIGRPVKAMANHPVMRGVSAIVTEDEMYRNMWHAPKIQVLMESDNPLNDTPLVYIGPTPEFKAVYIQLGHSAETFRHPAYRRLVHNAVLWTAGRVN
jgi:type 1 glutamine amidotransferase